METGGWQLLLFGGQSCHHGQNLGDRSIFFRAVAAALRCFVRLGGSAPAAAQALENDQDIPMMEFTNYADYGILCLNEVIQWI